MAKATSVVSKSQPIKDSGTMFVVDNLNRKITVSKYESSVALLVAYGIHYDTSASKWRPYYHAGVLCYDNEFNVDNATYNYCLLHALPADQKDTGTKVNICFSTFKSDMEQILGNFISSTGWRTNEEYIGKSGTALSSLARLSVSVSTKTFRFRGMRDRISAKCPDLVLEGETNCLHTALLFLEVMGFGHLSFNDRLMQLSCLCYQRIIDMPEKYSGGDFKSLMMDMIKCYKYSHKVDSQTTERICDLMKKLCECNEDAKKAYDEENTCTIL